MLQSVTNESFRLFHRSRLSQFLAGAGPLRHPLLFPTFLPGIRLMKKLFRLTLVAVAVVWSACSPGGPPGGPRYLAIHRSGLNRLPYPHQMEALFGKGDHFITHYGQSGPLTWNTHVYFYGRYLLGLQVDVEVDYSAKTVVREVGPPTFYFIEYIDMRKDSDGMFRPVHGGHQWNIGRAEWEMLVAGKGDFRVIGKDVVVDQALPHWGEYVKRIRNMRIPVDDGRSFVPIP